ncbi:MAG TPA: ergothioneine biosynthesis protein EgtB [Candidatus Solibacter sp.]|jgi:iron(II)-dependent oxidoreductase|nr:ergothioneine biosynthesis protein EgtB [Candidatus Solibacter sp.]
MELKTATDRKSQIIDDLEEARARTNQLLDPVDDERLMKQQNRLMSPLVWDAGHIGVFEELWLVQSLTGSAPIDEQRMHLYDAFDNPRWVRGSLPLLNRQEVAEYRDVVRRRAVEILDEVDLEGEDQLTRNGFVYDMIVQHEHQHNETILQALQLLPGGYRPVVPEPPRAREVVLDGVAVPAGEYPIGSDSHEPYDNEHPLHSVRLRAYDIDRFPVTCGQYLAFIDDSGYSRRELWSEAGWAWRAEEKAVAPMYWRRDESGWVRDQFGHLVAVESNHPVMHVSFHEAEAYCRWAGRRLPTEFEWEVAAAWDPQSRKQRRYPWGDEEPNRELANLDQRLFGTAPVGAFPQGASALGCEQMLGDVYEWTTSEFVGYPGYTSFPYKEYSEVFFGDEYKVLRGASWATRPRVARNTFRNWDYPIRRQIFSGFRTAGDA